MKEKERQTQELLARIVSNREKGQEANAQPQDERV